MSARGEPALWLMGASLLLSVVLIISLLGLIIAQGMSTFWPRPVDLVQMQGGESFLGVATDQETFEPAPADRARFEAMRDTGELSDRAVGEGELPVRRLYRVGNREWLGQPFRWVSLFEIESIERPADPLYLERLDWGIFIGMPEAIIERRDRVLPAGAPLVEEEVVEGQRIVRRAIGEAPEGGARIIEDVYLATGAEETWRTFQQLHPEAMRLRGEIEDLNRGPLELANRRIERQRLRIRAIEMRRAGLLDGPGAPPGWRVWILLVAGALGAGAGAVALGRARARAHFDRIPALTLARNLAWVLCAGLALAAALERPWADGELSEAAAAAGIASAREKLAAAEADAQIVLDEIRALEERNGRHRLLIRDIASGNLAPVAQSRPDEPLEIGQVVRAFPPNELSLAGKVRIYLSRWWEFLSTDPRANNTEGGVFPVIMGTVLLTLLLSVAVVPLGVIAAIYLREYATQGTVTSMVRIAVNNLAGVPSIVYGVFGLGFFAYTVGSFVDNGPEAGEALGRGRWWPMVGGALLVAAFAMVCGYLARPRPGRPATRLNRVMRFAAAALWIGAVAMAVYIVGSTPYFGGFFPVQGHSGTPVYGTPGMLWASLTLALLTLPVVIVATEEAIAAVPNSAREGSYGCGASQWQTIRRIVLPAAMPGIMTGMILAMARGAGEVAPLMIVGAVKKVSQLPYSSTFPFIHPERSFMHLGFHIYDLGFQSPDSEAARPMVWTTTLLLIGIVVLMNIVAITIRARLGARLRSGHF